MSKLCTLGVVDTHKHYNCWSTSKWKCVLPSFTDLYPEDLVVFGGRLCFFFFFFSLFLWCLFCLSQLSFLDLCGVYGLYGMYLYSRETRASSPTLLRVPRETEMKEFTFNVLQNIIRDFDSKVR